MDIGVGAGPAGPVLARPLFRQFNEIYYRYLRARRYRELVSECQLPECQLPKYQLPKRQLPKMSTPKMPTPKMSTSQNLKFMSS